RLARPTKRAWGDVQQALDQAAAKMPDSLEVLLLQADVRILEGQYEPARLLLEKLQALHPKRVEIWGRLVVLADRSGWHPGGSADLLDRAQRELGDTVAMRRLRISYWGMRRGAAARKALDELARGLAKFTAAEQLDLQTALADAYRGIGELGESERLWGLVAEQRKDDVHAHLKLFDLASTAGRTEQLQARVDDLKRIEGEEGTLWR